MFLEAAAPADPQCAARGRPPVFVPGRARLARAALPTPPFARSDYRQSRTARPSGVMACHRQSRFAESQTAVAPSGLVQMFVRARSRAVGEPQGGGSGGDKAISNPATRKASWGRVARGSGARIPSQARRDNSGSLGTGIKWSGPCGQGLLRAKNEAARPGEQTRLGRRAQPWPGPRSPEGQPRRRASGLFSG